jgi:hypothetical protein
VITKEGGIASGLAVVSWTGAGAAAKAKNLGKAATTLRKQADELLGTRVFAGFSASKGGSLWSRGKALVSDVRGIPTVMRGYSHAYRLQEQAAGLDRIAKQLRWGVDVPIDASSLVQSGVGVLRFYFPSPTGPPCPTCSGVAGAGPDDGRVAA